MTTFPHLIQLQVTNGDKVLEQHISESPSNAKYTSTFSIAGMIEAIDTWLERRLLESLRSSPFSPFRQMSAKTFLCRKKFNLFRWMVSGIPEEHFLTVLHIKSANAKEITRALTIYISDKELEYSWTRV